MTVLFKNKGFEWVDCEHPDAETISQLKEQYKLDPLLVADSLEVGHLPKFEAKEDYEFIIVRYYNKEKAFYHNIVRQYSNKIAIFKGKNFLITIHQQPVAFLSSLSNDMDRHEHKDAVDIRHILYKIFKFVFESYQEPANEMAEEIDRYEGNIFIGNRKKLDLKAMYQIKREASSCRKVLTINLDALKEINIGQKNNPQFRDIMELNQKMLHLHGQLLEDAQNLMSLSIGISDQKANEVMKVLTIFSAFFLPLSFIAGLYGMNFDYMPELHYKWSYPLVLIGMLAVVTIIFIWFRRKNIL